MKKTILLFIIAMAMLYTNAVWAQPYLKGDFNSWGTDDQMTSSLGTSYIITKTFASSPTFKFHGTNWYGATDGTVNTNEKTTDLGTPGSDTQISSFNSNNYYVFKWIDASSNAYIFEFSNAPVSITSISGPTGTVSTPADQTVTVNLSGTPDANERVYLRYTTDDWSSSQMVEADPSSNTVDITIPGQSDGTTVRYYVFTSGVSGVAVADADLATIAYDNNGGSNYSYTVDVWNSNTQICPNSATTTGRTLDITWDDTYIYFFVNSGFSASNGDRIHFGFDVNPEQDGDANGTKAAFNGCTFPDNYRPDIIYRARGTGNNTWQNDKGVANGSNGWTYTGNIGNSDMLSTASSNTTNLEVRIKRTAIGTFTDLGIFVWLGNSSDVKYDAFPEENPSNNGTYMPYVILFEGLGAGNPADLVKYDAQFEDTRTLTGRTVFRNMLISNSATVTAHNIGSQGTAAYESTNDLLVAGNLEIESSSTLTLDDQTGNDLWLEGDFTNNGTFTHSDRALFFSGSTDQTINTATVPFLLLASSKTGSLLLGQDLNLNGTGDDVLTLAGGSLNLNGHTLTMAGDGNIVVDNASRSITGTGTIDFTTSSNTVEALNSGRLDIGENVTVKFSGGNLDFGDDAGTRITTLRGTVIVTGSGLLTHNPTYETTSTLEYQNTGGGITAGGEWPASGNTPPSITINGGNPVTLDTDKAISGTLTITSGSVLAGGHAITYNSGSTLKYNGTSTQTTTDVEFPASGVHHLIVDNDVNLNNTKTIGGDLSITTGHTLDVTTSNYGLNIAGGFTNNGTFTPQNGTVTFNGTTTQEVKGGATTFYDLTLASGKTGDLIFNNDGSTITVGNDLTINGGRLVVNPAKVLDVNGTFINNNGTSGLLLKSDDTGTAILLHNTNGVAGTVQQYLHRANEYLYVSSPLTDATAAVFGVADPDKLYYYNAGSGWVRVTNTTDALTAGQGYAYKTDATKTVSFAGIINNGDVSPTVTYTGNNKNLLGNPFPSAVDIEAVTLTNIQGATIYYKEGGAGDAGGSVYHYQKGTGGDGARHIAPMQSFWVIAESSPVVTIPNSARTTHNDANFLKNTTNDQPPILTLTATAPATGYHDEISVVFNPTAAEGYDIMDANKMYGDGTPELYMLVDNKKLCINHYGKLEADVLIPVGIQTGKAGNYTFDITGIETFPCHTSIYLIDQESGQINNWIDLRTQNSYSFFSYPYHNHDRFALYFAPLTTSEETPLQSAIRAFAYNKTIVVELPPTATQGRVEVLDVSGRSLLSRTAQTGLNTFEMPHPAGIYIVKVTTNTETLTQRVMIE